MNHNFNLVVGTLERDKLRFYILVIPGGRINLKYLTHVLSLVKFGRINQIEYFRGVGNILANDKNEWLDHFHIVVQSKNLQFSFGILMDADRIFQFQYFNIPISTITLNKILSCCDRRIFHVFPISQGLCQRILIHNIPEHSPCIVERSCSKFYTQYRFEFIDRIL